MKRDRARRDERGKHTLVQRIVAMRVMCRRAREARYLVHPDREVPAAESQPDDCLAKARLVRQKYRR